PERALASAVPLDQEMQPERCLPRPRLALDHVQVPGGQPAAENLVQAGDARRDAIAPRGRAAPLCRACRHSLLPRPFRSTMPSATGRRSDCHDGMLKEPGDLVIHDLTIILRRPDGGIAEVSRALGCPRRPAIYSAVCRSSNIAASAATTSSRPSSSAAASPS